MKTLHKFLTDLGIDPNNFTLYKLILSLIVFLVPIFWTAIGIVSLIGFDFITGVVAAKKNKEPLSSRKASGTIYKLFLYLILLIVGLIADRLLQTEFLVKVITYFLVSVETLSISENFQKITGVPFVKYIKSFLESKIKGVKD